LHVVPAALPHVASVEMAVGVATAAADETVDEPLLEQVGAGKDEVLATRAAGVRYQFASGSPMHSPSVTILNPRPPM